MPQAEKAPWPPYGRTLLLSFYRLQRYLRGRQNEILDCFDN